MKVNNRVLGFLLAILSAGLSYLLIVLGYFPYLGIALFFAFISTLVYLLKTKKSRLDTVLYILLLAFSFFIFYRANGFLIFLNIATIFYLGSFISFPQLKDNNFGFLNFIFSPLSIITASFFSHNDFKIDFKSDKKISNARIFEVAKSLGISIVLLLVIIPLLASSNPFFNKIVSGITKIFYLDNFLKWLSTEDSVVWVVRSIFFLFLAYFLPRFLSYINTAQNLQKIPNLLQSISFFLPKVLVSIVIFIFFITQAQLYFSSSESLKAIGYSHSQYAREVFAQLSIVAVIILGLIYNDKSKNKWSKNLTYILVTEGVFLAFMALKSVYDYSFAWGFTFKRLWGYTGVFWILGILAFFLYKYIKNLKDSEFVKGVVVFSGFTLLLVNLLNFDYLIYHYRKSATGSGIDYFYLSRLSPDSRSYKEQYQFLITKSNTSSPEDYYLLNNAAWYLIRSIEILNNKYKTIDFRTLNFAEYRQYSETKNLDIKELYKITELNNGLRPIPVPNYPEDIN